MLTTLIRFNIAFMLSLLSLAIVGFIGLVCWLYASQLLKAKSTVTFFTTTTCAQFLADVKSQNSTKIEPYVTHFETLDTEEVATFDKPLSESEAGFTTLMRGCYKQPNHTLRQIMLEGEGRSLAAQLTDLYNTIDGELKTPNPMAPEFYISPTEVISPTLMTPPSEGADATSKPEKTKN